MVMVDVWNGACGDFGCVAHICARFSPCIVGASREVCAHIRLSTVCFGCPTILLRILPKTNRYEVTLHPPVLCTMQAFDQPPSGTVVFELQRAIGASDTRLTDSSFSSFFCTSPIVCQTSHPVRTMLPLLPPLWRIFTYRTDERDYFGFRKG